MECSLMFALNTGLQHRTTIPISHRIAPDSHFGLRSKSICQVAVFNSWPVSCEPFYVVVAMPCFSRLFVFVLYPCIFTCVSL